MTLPAPGRDAPEPVPGRAAPLPDFVLQRLRANRLLQACLVLAFMCYGGLAFLLVAGRELDHAIAADQGMEFLLVTLVTLLSLASWAFLFLWYPAFQRMLAHSGRGPESGFVPRFLEGMAITCVAVVHVLMAILVVYLARVGSPVGSGPP